MRLRPYTTVLPKPLMPLGNRPLLEILLLQLQGAGIRHAIVSVNHLAHLVRAVLDNVAPDTITVEYQYESEPLGTCGALTLIRERLPARFLVVNGDLLSDYPIARLMRRHAESDAALTIGTRLARESLNCGVIQRRDDGGVSDYVEKPVQEHELSIGLYALERRAVDSCLERNRPADMPDLVHKLLDRGDDVRAIPVDCDWIDIGYPEDYLRAQKLFEQNGERYIEASRRC